MGSTSTSAATMVQNIVTNLPYIWDIVEAVTILLGCGLVVSGFLTGAKNAAESHHGGGKSAIALIIGGTLLINISTDLNVLSWTVFNEADQTGLSYQASSSSNGMGVYLQAAFGIIAIVGLYGIASGIYKVSESSSDSRHFFNGVTRVVGGIMAVNITATISLLGSTVGGALQSSISSILGTGT
jgi:hypothetical protein